MSAAPVFHDHQLAELPCLEAGVGDPLVWLHEPGRLTAGHAHELLAGRFRVLALEDWPAPEIDQALRAIGLEHVNLLGTGAAAQVALRLALLAPERISAVVLESPMVLMQGTSQLETAMAKLDVPTLAVFGTRDPDVPPDHGARYRALMPDCYYVLMYKAGRTVAADRPEAFAGLVADFLERREAFVVSNQPEKLAY